VQTVERTFAVLRALAAANGSAGVSHVARETGLAKSTVSRLLTSLEEIGVLERLDVAGNYAIGPGLAALTGGVTPAGSLREVTRPHLRDLVDEVGESAGLTVADGNTALYIDHVGADGAIQTRDWTGMRFPYHTVAGGHAMMMTWSDGEVEQYAARGLNAFTAATVTTCKELLSRVRRARRLGFAWTLQDFDDEINGVAAPIRDGGGRAMGAITVYGPSFRFPPSGADAVIGERVVEAAEMVEARYRAV